MWILHGDQLLREWPRPDAKLGKMKGCHVQSRECQKLNWPEHRDICAFMKRSHGESMAQALTLPLHPDFGWGPQRMDAAVVKFNRKFMFELQSLAVRALGLLDLVAPDGGRVEDVARWDEIAEDGMVVFLLALKKNPASRRDYRQLEVLGCKVVKGEEAGDDGEHSGRRNMEMRGSRWSFCVATSVVGHLEGKWTRLSVPRLERCRMREPVLLAILRMEETPSEALDVLQGSVASGKGRRLWTEVV